MGKVKHGLLGVQQAGSITSKIKSKRIGQKVQGNMMVGKLVVSVAFVPFSRTLDIIFWQSLDSL
jgi:hypothetical protein